jgi:hypothetical protein
MAQLDRITQDPEVVVRLASWFEGDRGHDCGSDWRRS